MDLVRHRRRAFAYLASASVAIHQCDGVVATAGVAEKLLILRIPLVFVVIVACLGEERDGVGWNSQK